MTNTPETPVIELLRADLRRAEILLSRPEVSLGNVTMWGAGVRFRLEKIYGRDFP